MNVVFDISDVVEEFSISKDQERQINRSIVEALTIEIHRNWIEAAKRNLNSTRNGYVRGLKIYDESENTKVIVLTGIFNNMLENGASAFDIKNGFRRSPKTVQKEGGGWYLTIPFRFATPGSIGESEVFAGILPQEVYDLVKEASPNTTALDVGSTGSKRFSLPQSKIPQPYDTLKTRNTVINSQLNKTYEAYKNKFSIFAGLGRDQKFYENTGQSTYGTFRRVSDNSDPNSWIHSGLKQYNLSQEALNNTDTDLIINNTTDKVLASLGFSSD